MSFYNATVVTMAGKCNIRYWARLRLDFSRNTTSLLSYMYRSLLFYRYVWMLSQNTPLPVC